MATSSFIVGPPLPPRNLSNKENWSQQDLYSSVLSAPLRTVRPIQNLRDYDRDTSVLVPPIRSMSIRSPPHHPSATSLESRNQASTYLSRDPVIITTHGAIRKAVNQLQGILDRPIKKTPKTIEVEEVANGTPHPRPETPPKITRRLTEYLENARGRKSLSTEEIERAVSSRIAKTLTSNIVATQESVVPPADEDDHDTEAGPVPTTMPLATPTLETPSSMILNIEQTQLPKAISKFGRIPAVRHKIQVHWEVPVTTSRRSSHSHRSMLQPTFPLGLPPALRLNGKDLAGDDRDQPREDVNFLKLQLDRASRTNVQIMSGEPKPQSGHSTISTIRSKKVDLSGHSHVDLPGRATDHGNHEPCSRNPSARNWRITRKRLTATVACINSSCIGLLIGVYAGEVPGIQYVIIDLNHYIILGNVLLYLGLALSTLTLWPLPLLHGRKPYTIASLTLTLCLQIPQGLAVSNVRLPDHNT